MTPLPPPPRRAALLLLLAARSTVAQSPKPPPACAPLATANGGCVYQCVGEPIYRFDLRSFNSSYPMGYASAQDTTGKSYYFGPCGAVQGVTCASSTSPGTPVAVQAWAGQPPTPDGCATLGVTTKPPNCTMQMDMNQRSMVCGYRGGDDGRSVTVVYKCRPGQPTQLTADQGDPSPLGETYTISVSGQAACAAVYTPPLSTGSLSLILFFVAAIVYVSGGVLYNVKVRQTELSLRAAFPQYKYWRQLPGLVTDGVAFSYEIAQKEYYTRVMGTAPPLAGDLKRRLADNEGGGLTRPDET